MIDKILSHLAFFFKRDENGVVAVVFGVILVPFLALAGAAIDYSRATSIKSQIQKSSDSAAIAGAGASVEDDSDVYITNVATRVFNENMMNSGFAGNVDIDVSQFDNEKGEGVSVIANTQMKTYFLKLVGKKYFDISVQTDVVIEASQLEVALALDNTGSMRGWKMASLKKSATMLVDILVPDDNDYVKIGLVPFADYVNVGLVNRNEPGIYAPPDRTVTICTNSYPNSTLSCGTKTIQTTCYSTVGGSVNPETGAVIGGTTKSYPCTQTVSDGNCTGSQGAAVKSCSNITYRWQGCVGSRNRPRDVRDDDYRQDEAPGFRNDEAYCVPQPLTRLTFNKNTMLNAINSMRASGMTYVEAGLVWGWSLLSRDYPFADALPYHEDNRKTLILMTDGQNTRAPSYPLHHSININLANDRTEQVCENIKAEEITIYTIAFGVGDNIIKNIMQDCATDDEKYFDARNADELEKAFKRIARELLDLRIVR